MEQTEGPIMYCVVLRPHRSANTTVINRVLVCVAVVWALVAIVFASVGAWPVMPFLGLEALLLIIAFRWNNFAGRAKETINLTATTLTVRQINHWGRQTLTRFPAPWLQVNIDEPPTVTSRIELRSHGRSTYIGRFLSPAERLNLAKTLRYHLARCTAMRTH